MESFFHSMKAEAIRGRHFATDGELRTVVRDYIRLCNPPVRTRRSPTGQGFPRLAPHVPPHDTA